MLSWMVLVQVRSPLRITGPIWIPSVPESKLLKVKPLSAA